MHFRVNPEGRGLDYGQAGSVGCTFDEVKCHLEAVGVVVAVVEHVRAERDAGRCQRLRRVQREQHRLQRLHAALPHHRAASRRLGPRVHLRWCRMVKG